MKCPQCNGEAIGFGKWGKGLNAFKYSCESCDAKLSANNVTKIGFALTLIVLIAAFVVVVTIGADTGRGSPVRFVGIIVPALIGGGLTYLLGGYEVTDK